MMVKLLLREVNESGSIICLGIEVAEVVNGNESIMFESFTQIRIKANGVWINAVIRGQGEPVLLLHDYPQSHVEWHKIAPTLADEYPLGATDLRGYRDSDKPQAAAEDLSIYCKRTAAQTKWR